MKKTQKRIFGCFGLGLVTTMTVVAATMPNPNASAVSSITSVVDTIQVRVVGDTPAITGITGIAQDAVVLDPVQAVTVAYENLTDLSVKLVYTTAVGTETEYILGTYSGLDYNAGEQTINLDLSEAQFNIDDSLGYGSYMLVAKGTGWNGVTTPDKVLEFSYAPFAVDAEQNETTGDIDITISDTSDNVDHIAIIVNGKEVENPQFDENGVMHYTPSEADRDKVDTYTIELVAYDKDGNIIYRQIIVVSDFDWDFIPKTADTGRFFTGLNIANEDYLVTGLIVFFILGVVGFGIVARNRNNTKSAKRR